jgi:hypothetical protein
VISNGTDLSHQKLERRSARLNLSGNPSFSSSSRPRRNMWPILRPSERSRLFRKDKCTCLNIWFYQVYIEPLMNASPPIITEEHPETFIKDVFFNMDNILQYDRHLLSNLFERQRDQHPLILAITDVVLQGGPDFPCHPRNALILLSSSCLPILLGV